MLDNTGRVSSLFKIVQNIMANPTVVTRDRFVGAYISVQSDPSSWRDTAERYFHKLAGQDTEVYPRDTVQADLKLLEQARSTTQDITNNRIAHLQPTFEISTEPLWRDVHNAVETIRDVCAKYNALLLQDDDNPGHLLRWTADADQEVEEFWEWRTAIL